MDKIERELLEDIGYQIEHVTYTLEKINRTLKNNFWVFFCFSFGFCLGVIVALLLL